MQSDMCHLMNDIEAHRHPVDWLILPQTSLSLLVEEPLQTGIVDEVANDERTIMNLNHNVGESLILNLEFVDFLGWARLLHEVVHLLKTTFHPQVDVATTSCIREVAIESGIALPLHYSRAETSLSEIFRNHLTQVVHGLVTLLDGLRLTVEQHLHSERRELILWQALNTGKDDSLHRVVYGHLQQSIPLFLCWHSAQTLSSSERHLHQLYEISCDLGHSSSTFLFLFPQLPISAIWKMGLGRDLHGTCIGVAYFILRSPVYLHYPILCYFSVPEAEP